MMNWMEIYGDSVREDPLKKVRKDDDSDSDSLVGMKKDTSMEEREAFYKKNQGPETVLSPDKESIDDNETVSANGKKTESRSLAFDDREPAAVISREEPEKNSSPASLYKEPKDNLELLSQNLRDCLGLVDDELMKGYVTQLEQLPVAAPIEGKSLGEALATLPDVQFFRITELVYQKDEFSVHKLASVFHALCGRECTLILMIRSDGDRSDFYLGVRSWKPLEYSVGTMRKMLENILMGMFPGSRVEPYLTETLEADMRRAEKRSASSVTCVADFKQGEEHVQNEDFVQGLEKFVDSMRGRSYTAIFLADSMEYGQVNELREAYENIYTQLSPFMQMQYAFSMNASKSDAASVSNSKGETYSSQESDSSGESSHEDQTEGTQENRGETSSQGESFAEGEGQSHQKGTSSGTNDSVSDGHTRGTSNTIGVSRSSGAGASMIFVSAHSEVGESAQHGWSESDTHTITHGTSHMDTVSDAVSKTLTRGTSRTRSETITRGTSKGRTTGTGRSSQHTEGYSRGETFSLTDTRTMTDTFGTSQGVTLNAKNRTLEAILERIDRQIARVEECESLGMWKFAAYFLGESAAETETAANIYYSVMAGGQSGIERSAVNVWREDSEQLPDVAEYLIHFCHPKFVRIRESDDQETAQGTAKKFGVIVDPAAYISTNELAIHMGLPRHSVKGLPVVEHAVFAQEVLNRKTEKNVGEINLGKVYHLGEEKNTPVKLNLQSLTMHTFVTGSTGAGKSNTVYHLLREARRHDIPFLVVEPAKGEYRKVFPEVPCYGTDPRRGEMLRINPFAFPAEVQALEHIDRLVEIFNVCWPMYAAMPAVLKEAIERAYRSAGWDLELSINTKMDGLFPTFDDVVTELTHTIRSSEYSEDTKGDYIGALSTRLRSLTNGINGRVFCGKEMDMEKLFDQPAILDLSNIGSMDTSALIMGIIVLKLKEYRYAQAKEMNARLRHLTVLEEAHNLLKKTSTEQSQESSNLQGKSVEMLTNIIAEIRSCGEGFVIVDQAPNLLDTAVIRNTNTKIVMRLPEQTDREITGRAMALNDDQIQELSKLETGVAAVYQNDWQEAVLCHVEQEMEPAGYVKPETSDKIALASRTEVQGKDSVLHRILKADLTEEENELLDRDIMEMNLSAKIRLALIRNRAGKDRTFEWAMADFIKKKYDLGNAFRGTGSAEWSNLPELADIMMQNLKPEFEGFSEDEMNIILYYVCLVEKERFPKNAAICQLANWLRGKAVCHSK